MPGFENMIGLVRACGLVKARACQEIPKSNNFEFPK